jgi:hypothetical protein
MKFFTFRFTAVTSKVTAVAACKTINIILRSEYND